MIMLIMLHIDLNHSSNDYRVLLRDLQAKIDSNVQPSLGLHISCYTIFITYWLSLSTFLHISCYTIFITYWLSLSTLFTYIVLHNIYYILAFPVNFIYIMAIALTFIFIIFFHFKPNPDKLIQFRHEHHQSAYQRKLHKIEQNRTLIHRLKNMKD